ncbi:hypothetical protein PtB15_6B72 [Puccinia triticina]|nr:hypothetical protein PtB15_6B72 [Puccinia triticina]
MYWAGPVEGCLGQPIRSTLHPLHKYLGMLLEIGPGAAQTIGVVVDALNSLTGNLTRTDANKAAEYSQGGISPEESARRKTALVEKSTSLLPCLRQQLADLLASLDIADLERVPNPRSLPATLDIIKKIGITLDQLICATRSVSLSPPPAPSRFEDHDCGILKVYRYDHFQQDITQLIETRLCPLFNQSVLLLEAWKSASNPDLSGDRPPLEEREATEHRKQIISLTALSHKSIDNLIKWLELEDDLGALQFFLQPEIDLLSSNQAELIQRIGLPLPPLPKKKDGLDDSDSSESDDYPSQSKNPNQEEGNISKGDVDNSHKEDEGEDEDGDEDGSEFDSNYSGSSASSGQSEEIPVRQATVKLAKKSMRMIKLILSFFSELWKARSSEAPFKLDERISSEELDRLVSRFEHLIQPLNEFVKLLLSIYDQDDFDEEELARLGSKSSSLSDAFDTCLLHLAFHLVPLDHQEDLIDTDPLAPNPFNTWFFQLRQNLGGAASRITWGLHSFRETVFD